MHSRSRLGILITTLVVSLFTTQASAQLEVEIDFDGSVQPAIVDNGVGDLNATVDIIDFDLTDNVNTDLSARGRVLFDTGPVGAEVEFTAITPDAHGVLRNDGAAPAAFKLTIRSPAYPAIGPPLGWALWHHGELADPLPDVVAVTNHSSTLSVDDEVLPLQTVLVPDIADAGDPPIFLDDFVPVGRGSAPTADATSTQAVLMVTLGPGDEYRAQAIDVETSDELTFHAHVFNQELKCVLKINKFDAKVFKTAAKIDEKCVKRADSSPASVCVTDPVAAKMEQIEAKALDFYDTFCVVPPPAWGANTDSCCEDSANEGAACSDNGDCTGGACVPGGCIAGAMNRISNGLVADLFGSTVDVDATERCSTKVYREAGKAVTARWKEFFKCKKNAIQSIDNDVDLVAQCLTGTEGNSKAASAEGKISDAIGNCSLPVATAFPGRCASESPFDDCVVARTRCRFCQSVNEADDIVPPFDCDLFDNAVADLSCADEALATTTTTTTTTTNTSTTTLPVARCCSSPGSYCGGPLVPDDCTNLGLTPGNVGDLCDAGGTGDCGATESAGPCCQEIPGVCSAGPGIDNTGCTNIGGTFFATAVCDVSGTCVP